jgi:hypothetical protein
MWHDFPVLAGLLAEADAALAELGATLYDDCTRTPRTERPPLAAAEIRGKEKGFALY